MKTVTYHRVNGARIARAATFSLLALAALLLTSDEARAQWTQPDAQGNINATNQGNVGIGTQAPGSAKLVIGGTAGTEGIDLATADQYANLRVIRNSKSTHDRDLYLQYGAGAGSKIRFYTDNNESMTLVGGSVGVGTLAPAFKFDVQGGAVNASGGLCIAGDCKTSWSQIGGGQWTTSGSSLLYNSGHVGIGTQSTGSAKLVIGGTAGTEGIDLATADQYANLRVIRNSKSTHDRDLYLQYGAGTGSKIRFYTDSNESMTLVGGKLGVGTTAPVAALDVNGDIRASGNISAKYQDLAEWVPTTQKLAAGTVVVLDTRNSNHVLASTTSYDTRVAGVISAQPGIMLGEAGEGKTLVATTGRVKVKVDATRGPVNVGDLLVTSDVAGVAMKSQPLELGGVPIHRPGTLIGKALEPLAGGTGEILVLLSLQ